MLNDEVDTLFVRKRVAEAVYTIQVVILLLLLLVIRLFSESCKRNLIMQSLNQVLIFILLIERH